MAGQQTGMIQPLADITLKTGERAQLACVVAPDPQDAWQVAPLLGHKGGAWNEHIAGALAGPLDGLETRFYVASVGGAAVSNVMLVEYAGAGILGHVFTQPDHRRKGLCEALFREMQADFLLRGGVRLVLGTGFDSAPYWIYHRHGFRPLLPHSGFMVWQPEPDFAERYYQAETLHVAPYAWRHWPALAQIWADDFGDGLQALAWRAFGPSNFEEPGVSLARDCARGEATALVLENQNGLALALATLKPDARWPGVTLLDFVGHPRCDGELARLLAALPRPAGKLQAWVPAAASARRAALEAAGFVLEAQLAGQLGAGRDVVAYTG